MSYRSNVRSEYYSVQLFWRSATSFVKAHRYGVRYFSHHFILMANRRLPAAVVTVAYASHDEKLIFFGPNFHEVYSRSSSNVVGLFTLK